MEQRYGSADWVLQQQRRHDAAPKSSKQSYLHADKSCYKAKRPENLLDRALKRQAYPIAQQVAISKAPVP